MKKNRGFTLIELLIVIAIIGILTSVIIGSFKNSKKTPKEKCLKTMEYTTLQYLPVSCLKYLDTDISLIKN